MKEVLKISLSLTKQLDILHKNGFENIDVSDLNISWDGHKTAFLDLDSLQRKGEKSYIKTQIYWQTNFAQYNNQDRDFKRVAMLFLYLIGDQNYFLSLTNNFDKSYHLLTHWALQIGTNPSIFEFLVFIMQKRQLSAPLIERKITDSINFLTNEKNDTLSATDQKKKIQQIVYQAVLLEKVVFPGTQKPLSSLIDEISSNKAAVTHFLQTKLSNDRFAALNIGLSGLAGIIYLIDQLRDDNLRPIFDKIILSIRQRMVSIQGRKYVKMYKSINSPISPYLSDGFAGLAIVTSNLTLLDKDSFDFCSYANNLPVCFSKSAGLWDGLSGIALALLSEYLNSSKPDPKLLVCAEKCLNNALDFLLAQNSQLYFDDFHKYKLTSNYSRGPQGFYDVIAVYLNIKN
ncbi:hypothetical protein DLJ48_02125 [Oenococcus sicerae]|uniref:Lanthionine synthetase C-like protein n=1 Tax=Oenococcus sicerae TaxID=2203724 RepID=A0ABX5QKW7_9LACO|nr:hypothetical protein [Oenococcus sicerae]QAS69402.1 hypothetical protein DLJ48_02125 [Oenococcus sicerae]